MMFVLLFVAFINCQSQNLCGSSSTRILNFDDLDINHEDGYIELPQPYKNFIIKRINSPNVTYSDNHIPAINSSNPSVPSEYYGNSAVSTPNFILTTGEYLSISKANGGTFAIISLQIKSIFIDQMPVLIRTLRLGVVVSNTTINLSSIGPTLVNINKKQLDQIVIGCANHDLETCAHMSYDNIVLCRV